MATIRWCPIFPKWDIYQPLLNAWWNNSGLDASLLWMNMMNWLKLYIYIYMILYMTYAATYLKNVLDWTSSRALVLQPESPDWPDCRNLGPSSRLLLGGIWVNRLENPNSGKRANLFIETLTGGCVLETRGGPKVYLLGKNLWQLSFPLARQGLLLSRIYWSIRPHFCWI